MIQAIRSSHLFFYKESLLVHLFFCEHSSWRLLLHRYPPKRQKLSSAYGNAPGPYCYPASISRELQSLPPRPSWIWPEQTHQKRARSKVFLHCFECRRLKLRHFRILSIWKHSTEFHLTLSSYR